MDEIIFEFPENTEEINKANLILQFLVNRAAEFNKDKYEYFIINRVDNKKEDYLFYHILSILSIMYHLPIYVTKKANKMPWNYEVTYNTRIVNWWKLLYLKLKKRGLSFSLTTIENEYKGKLPQIYLGISQKTISRIVDNIYEYEERYGC